VGISPYVADLRKRIGSSRLLLPSVTAILYGPLGEILLVHQRDGNVWSTPGGSIEPDENPVDAVMRETWEETGLLVQPTALIGVFGGPSFVVRYDNGDETQYVMSVFECSVKSGEITSVTDEVTACRFIPEDEFHTLRVPPWTREVLPLCYLRPSEPIIGPSNWIPPVPTHTRTV
jgi:8-oxo-dGTP pyrophosphatase MutT (NUDIX family)